ncbi:MAG TPA: biotin/lipoyl-containing protein [Candidatus Dormibacteraeota bacterium]|nr:biotin/lipoyl-containing protein [Candidatus Dormibacteraeota bacterium]
MEERETLEELLGIMREHDLDRIKVKAGDAVYELVRRQAQSPATFNGSAAAPQGTETPARSSAAPANVKRVLAPLTGVFYRQPSPDVDPFVSEGDRVDIGQVLCVLEAMKLFNEIQSDYAGTIVRVIPGNGELVSQGEELFWIQP